MDEPSRLRWGHPRLMPIQRTRQPAVFDLVVARVPQAATPPLLRQKRDEFASSHCAPGRVGPANAHNLALPKGPGTKNGLRWTAPGWQGLSTCCLPSQPSLHADYPTRSRLRRKRDGFLVSLALSHHGPDHSGDLVGERDSRNLRRPPRQQGREPWAMLGAMDLGVADDGERPGHEQAAPIAD